MSNRIIAVRVMLLNDYSDFPQGMRLKYPEKRPKLLILPTLNKKIRWVKSCRKK